MTELIGWSGGLLLGICGLPQAIQCIREGHAYGVNKLFIWLWFIGELLMQIYVLNKHGLDLPLLSNYWFNTLICIVILKYMHFPRTLDTPIDRMLH